jgi:hypothetical protein
MDIFKKKYDKYINFKEMFLRTKNDRLNKEFIYPLNNQKGGGKIKEIEKMLKKYKDIDIEIDSFESTDESIIINIFNINRVYTCAIFIIDNDEKITSIRDLRSDCSCIKNNNQVMKYIINSIIEISKFANMKKIQLTDNSYHTCKNIYNKGDNSKFTFRLDIANTLTNGVPYYYKYGFKYSQEKDHINAKKNNKKLKKYLTSILDINKLTSLITIKLNKIELSKETIDKDIQNIIDLYNKYKDHNIKKFLYHLKYEYCQIFSLIYTYIFENLKLYNYYDKIMYYNIIN